MIEDNVWFWYLGLSFIGAPEHFFANRHSIRIDSDFHAKIDNTERVTRLHVLFTKFDGLDQPIEKLGVWPALEMMLDEITLK